MKKTILILISLTLHLAGWSQFLTGEIPYSDSTANPNSRGPNGNVRYHIMCAYYSRADLDSVLRYLPGSPYSVSGQNLELTQFGFVVENSNAPNIASGNIKIYMQNTTDVGNTKSTTWSTCITGMQKVYDGPIDILNEDYTMWLALTAPFQYQNDALYLAFEYSNPTGTLSGVNTSYMSYANTLSSIRWETSSTAVPSSFTGTGQGAVNGVGSRKPVMEWDYRVVGKEITIKGVKLPVAPIVNTTYPISVTLENLGTINVTAYTVAISVDGVQIGTNSGPQIPKGSVITFPVCTWRPTIADKFYKITTKLSLTADKMPENNSDTSYSYVFYKDAILKEGFNDTAVFKNDEPACIVGNGWSFISNDGIQENGFFAGFKFEAYRAGEIDHLADELPFEGGVLTSGKFSSNYATEKTDKWLISPLVANYCSTETDSLLFYLASDMTSIPDSVELWLSPTGGGSISDFTINPVDISVLKQYKYIRYAYKINNLLPGNVTSYRFALRYHHEKADSITGCDQVYFDDISINRYITSIQANGAASTNGLTGNFICNNFGSGVSYQWDFTNDGTFDSNQQNPSFTYTSPGTYSVNLRVTSNCAVDDTLMVIQITAPGINEYNNSKVAFGIQPNPAKEYVTINTNEKEYAIQIINMLGETLYISNYKTPSSIIDINNFKTGTYIVKIILPDGRIGTNRLIIID